jgi:hypothetical protein
MPSRQRSARRVRRGERRHLVQTPRVHKVRIGGGDVVRGGPSGRVKSDQDRRAESNQSTLSRVDGACQQQQKSEGFSRVASETRRVCLQRCAFVRSRLRSKYHASALARCQESGETRDDARLENVLYTALSRGIDCKESAQRAPGTRQRTFETSNQWKPTAKTARARRHDAESRTPPEVLMPAFKKTARSLGSSRVALDGSTD